MSDVFEPPHPEPARRAATPPRQAAAAARPLLIGTIDRAGRRVLPGLGVHRRLDRPALVRERRLLRGLHQGAVDQASRLFLVFGLLMAVVGRRPTWCVAYRFRPLFRPDVARAGQPRPLPRGGRPAAHVAAGRRARSCSACSPAAPASGQWRSSCCGGTGSAVRHDGPVLPQGRRLLRLRPAVAALPGRLRPWPLTVLGAARRGASCTTCTAASGCRPSGDRLSGAAQVQISVLLGLFVLLKAVDYWLDRYDLTTAAGSLFTGMAYTDQHAVLPAKTILMFIALICAVLFFANVFRRTWLLPVGRARAAGALRDPARRDLARRSCSSSRSSPPSRTRRRRTSTKNIEATRAAYGIADSSGQRVRRQPRR